MRIKRIRARLIKTCNLCGKKFDRWDEEENFCFYHRFGYGSAYDGYQLHLNLCCHCFDSLMDELVPRCKTNPLPTRNWRQPMRKIHRVDKKAGKIRDCCEDKKLV